MSEDDSTDWLTTNAPFLHKFEDGLRCPICRDMLVRAPSMTECGHTFCAECIGRHFNTSERCPVCRSEIRRAHLRLNKALSDLADQWQAGTRAELMQLATKLVVPEPSMPDPASEQNVVFISDSEAEEAPALDIPEGHGQCPVCGKVMPIAKIQSTHITQCLNGSSSPASPSLSAPQTASSPQTVTSPALPEPAAKRRKRAVFGQEFPESKLAVPHFHSMNDTKLRAKAKEAGISVKGTRQRIISRYMEWLTVWNSSVDDDKHPRTVTALRKHMAEWDKVQDRVSEGAPSLKKLDSKQWTQTNNDSFADLINKARASKKPTPSTEPVDSSASNGEPNAASSSQEETAASTS